MRINKRQFQMNFLQSISCLSKIVTKNDNKKVRRKAISKLFSVAPKNINSFEHSERIGLTLILNGQEKKALKLLKITRNFPKDKGGILLVVLLSANLDKILMDAPSIKRNPIGEPINSPIFSEINALKNTGQRAISCFSVNYNKDVMDIVKPKNDINNFEIFFNKRFGDIRNSSTQVLTYDIYFKFIQAILCGYETDITEIKNDKIKIRKEIRFENHTLSSSSQLLDRFIQIGNSRIKLTKLLRYDSISFEIKKYLTRFDSYVSALYNESLISILIKIQSFNQVFRWFSKILQFNNFDFLHNELLISSQTLLKKDISLKFYRIAFYEEARPLYLYAFNGQGSPNFINAFEPLKYDCLSSGKLYHYLNKVMPSHPIFDLSNDFMESFLMLKNRLKEYERKSEYLIQQQNDILKKEKRIYENNIASRFVPFTEEEIKLNEIRKYDLLNEFQKQINPKEDYKENISLTSLFLNDSFEKESQIMNNDDNHLILNSSYSNEKLKYRTNDDETEKEKQYENISALFYRFVIPSFELQHKIISKSLYSILILQENFPNQLLALTKLLLILPSSIVDDFIYNLTSIPYNQESFKTINHAFVIASKKLNFDGIAQVGQTPNPSTSSYELINRINNMPIIVQVNQKFSCLLPETIIDSYISIFRILVLLKLSKDAINKLWKLTKNSSVTINSKAFILMSHFVTCIESYFYNTILWPSFKSFDNIFYESETIEEFNQKHESILHKLLSMLLLLPESKEIYDCLVQTLIEIYNYSLSNEIKENNISAQPFLKCYHNFLRIIKGYNSSTSNNNIYIFLNTIFSIF